MPITATGLNFCDFSLKSNQVGRWISSRAAFRTYSSSLPVCAAVVPSFWLSRPMIISHMSHQPRYRPRSYSCARKPQAGRRYTDAQTRLPFLGNHQRLSITQHTLPVAQILLYSASNVYNILRETEKLLRAQEDWLTTICIKPGALLVDKQRGHALSLTKKKSFVSYLDLAAAMVEAANDEEGRYNMRNVGVVNTNGTAKFPAGTPICILMGLLRHFFLFIHLYLPSTGLR